MTNTLVEAIAAETRAVLSPLTVDQYRGMIEAGLLPEGAPIELIDGLLVRKDRHDSHRDIRTAGTRHINVVKRLLRILNRLVSSPLAHVQSQQPIALPPHDEPEPDVAIVRGDEDDYSAELPTAADVPLVIEVAHGSLSFDLGRKQALDRQGGIAAYRVVNLRDDVIEVFRGPGATAWREHQRLSRGQMLETTL